MDEQIRPPIPQGDIRSISQPDSRGWFERNWKWFVPLVVAGGAACFVGFMALIVTFVFALMKSSDAYKDAVAMARADPDVQAAIGTPIEEGLFVTGSIETSGASGDADLAIPISGPKGKATIYLVATKSAGEWSFSTLNVGIAGASERIDLIE